jgi:hypothetical protein
MSFKNFKVNRILTKAVSSQLRVEMNVIPEESFFNPAQCLIVTRCFQHDRLVMRPRGIAKTL